MVQVAWRVTDTDRQVAVEVDTVSVVDLPRSQASTGRPAQPHVTGD